MSFKLISEAQALSRLGDNASLALAVQSILGESSITSVSKIFEAFDPSQHQITPEDYNAWMQVLQAEAADRGANLSKKTDFEDLAHLMFENDPRVDELGLDDKAKQQIVKTMWASFKASKAHAGVQASVAGAIDKAREEEEAAASEFEQAFKAAQGVEDEESKPKYSWRSAVAGGKKNPYAKGSLRHNLWNDVNGAEENEELHDTDELAGADDVTVVGAVGGDEPKPEDLASRVADLETRVAEIETDEQDEPWHDDDAGEEIDLDTGDGADTEESPVQRAARIEIEDEETVKKKMFRQAITAPRQELSQALKDVEAEGKSAWAKLQVPVNPHPKKSQAHNAWFKGLRSSAKETLGIVDKPAAPAKKPAKRK